jgi:protein TonB
MEILKRNIFIVALFIFSNSSTGQINKDSLFNCSGNISSIGNQKVYTIVEVMPKYPEGEDALLRMIKWDNVSQEEHQSRITISFIIDTLGNTINKCIKKPYYEDKRTKLEMAALHSLDSMQKWTPGFQNGEKVPVRFEIPIHISMK